MVFDPRKKDRKKPNIGIPSNINGNNGDIELFLTPDGLVMYGKFNDEWIPFSQAQEKGFLNKNIYKSLQIEKSLTLKKGSKIKLYGISDKNYTSFRQATDATVNIEYVLPKTAAGSNKILQSDSNNQLSWVTASTDTDTTYSISCDDGDNSDEEKIVLTAGGSGSGTDTIVLEAGTGLSISRSTDKITFTNTVTDTDTVLTAEQVQDIVGAMLSSNTETGITATYEDGDGTIDLVVDDSTKLPLAGGDMTGHLQITASDGSHPGSGSYVPSGSDWQNVLRLGSTGNNGLNFIVNDGSTHKTTYWTARWGAQHEWARNSDDTNPDSNQYQPIARLVGSDTNQYFQLYALTSNGVNVKLVSGGSSDTYFNNSDNNVAIGSTSAGGYKLKVTGTTHITGALTTDSTIDGRDVAADGSKLDGIEASATADQTGPEIATLLNTDLGGNFTIGNQSDDMVTFSGPVKAVGTLFAYRQDYPQLALSDDNGTDKMYVGVSGEHAYIEFMDDEGAQAVNTLRFRGDDQTGSGDYSNADVMTVDFINNRVGINNTSPNHLLHVGDDVSMTFATTPDKAIQLSSTTGGHEVAYILGTIEGGVSDYNIRSKYFVDDATQYAGWDTTYTTGLIGYEWKIANTQKMKLDTSGNLTLSGTVDGRDVATDGSKLDGIASGAEVNVSGDSGNSAIYDNSGTPTLKSGITQGEMQTAIGGVYTDTNTNQLTVWNYDIDGGSAVDVAHGQNLRINTGNGIDINEDGPREFTIECEAASTTNQGMVELATNAETITGTDTSRAVTPAGLQAKLPSIHWTRSTGGYFTANNTSTYTQSWEGDETWGNTVAITTALGGAMSVSYSDVYGGIWIAPVDSKVTKSSIVVRNLSYADDLTIKLWKINPADLRIYLINSVDITISNTSSVVASNTDLTSGNEIEENYVLLATMEKQATTGSSRHYFTWTVSGTYD